MAKKKVSITVDSVLWRRFKARVKKKKMTITKVFENYMKRFIR